ncbi:hypothetical protein NDU88_002236 [Pleurodeles waltl]|uniref:Uncharacterized protein n=1 Tax=Pleurodeles waltl TaxID=8319 RepID=A0AAV7PA92_PLEWA|nr:hypothetical protein NDU88_002236 [Pleurodeles waltl]
MEQSRDRGTPAFSTLHRGGGERTGLLARLAPSRSYVMSGSPTHVGPLFWGRPSENRVRGRPRSLGFQRGAWGAPAAIPFHPELGWRRYCSGHNTRDD